MTGENETGFDFFIGFGFEFFDSRRGKRKASPYSVKLCFPLFAPFFLPISIPLPRKVLTPKNVFPGQGLNPPRGMSGFPFVFLPSNLSARRRKVHSVVLPASCSASLLDGLPKSPSFRVSSRASLLSTLRRTLSSTLSATKTIRCVDLVFPPARQTRPSV